MEKSTAYLLAQNPPPTDDEIKKGLEGNLCRCTGYANIAKAVRTASETLGAVASAPAAAGV